MQPHRYVFNKSKNGIYVVHEPNCPSIRHQVDGDLREILPKYRYEIVDSTDDGTTLYSETREWERSYYDANYLTEEDILESKARFRPCLICQPPFLEHIYQKPNRIHVSGLKPFHLGKVFYKYGKLVEYTYQYRTDGWTVILKFENRDPIFFDSEHDASLYYPRKTHHNKYKK